MFLNMIVVQIQSYVFNKILLFNQNELTNPTQTKFNMVGPCAMYTLCLLVMKMQTPHSC